MRGVCVLFLLGAVVYANSLPLIALSGDDAAFPAANGFLKMAYSRIEEADVKSLMLTMLQSYRELCSKYGAWRVSQELRLIYDSHNRDLKINGARLGKLGSLLRRLENEIEDEEGEDGDDSGARSGPPPRLRQQALPI
jgi:hypothetical protein